VVGAGAYASSFSGAFVFDDLIRIVDNPRIHSFWPLWGPLLDTARPVVTTSFALNYLLGGTQVWGYHAVNLLIHMAADLLLFFIVQNTLQSQRLKARFEGQAGGIALASALIWLAHPLNTQSVTYIVQRAESLMGFFYLLALWSLIQGVTTKGKGWHRLCALACVLGMATKPVMVTAPLVLLIYDRVFLAGSLGEVLRKRWKLYLGLAATWLALAHLIAYAPGENKASVGLALREISVFEYAATQPGVILHYLKLAFWSQPLVFDYHWTLVESFKGMFPQAFYILG